MTNQNKRSYDDPIKKRLSCIDIIAWVLASLLLFVWFRIGWVIFYPYKPFIIHSPKLTVLNEGKKVCRGDDLCVQADTEKTMNVPTIIHTTLVNRYTYALAPFVSNREPGRKVVTVQIPIGHNVELGKYFAYRTFTNKVSDFPTKDITVSAWSEEFEVIDCGIQPKGDK